MAQSFSLEDALGGASESTSTPAVGFSLEEALGVPAAPEAPVVPGPTPGLVSFINEPKAPNKKFTGSVFDTQPFEPEITPEEAVRLSRRDYAERTARLPGRVQEAKETPEEQLQRSALRAAGDTAIGVLQGAVAIPKGITDNIPFDNPLSQFYKDAYEAGEKSKSGYLRSKNVERAALLDNIRRNQGELAATRGAFTTLFSPSGADIVAQGAGSMVPAVGMSVLNLGTKSMMAMNALANAGDAAQQTAARLADMSPQEWSNSAAYQSLREQGLDHRDAVRMLAPLYALPSQAIGGITGAVSGGTGLESALVKGGARSARARLGRAGVELVGEEAETLAPMLAGNITQRIIDDRTALFEGLGQAAVETGVAAGPGAGLAAALSGKPRETAAPVRPAQEAPIAPQPTEIKPATEPFTIEDALGTPAAPTAPIEVAPVSPAVQRMQEQQRAAAELEAAPEPAPIVQNASIMQAHPDYEQEVLAPARDAIAQNNFKPVVLKDGTRVNLVVSQNEGNTEGRVLAIDSSGQEVGQLMFAKVEDEEGGRFNPHAFVDDSMRRRGLATAMYDLAEASGAKIPTLEQPGQIRSEEGEAFRRARAGLPPQTRSLAEEMEGVPAPLTTEAQAEIDRLTADQNAALAALEEMSKRTAGTSLIKVLKGTLNDGELSELGGRARQVGKNPFLNLKASKGQRGSSMEDMVDSGKLNLFLPPEMQPDAPGYVNSDAAEYIREKLRNGEFYTYETERAIKQVNDDIEAIEKQIQELLSEDEINKEIQYAVNEQREIDQAAAEPAPEEEVGAAAERAGEEEVLKAQTEEELRAKADREEAAARKEEEARREEERKAAAPKAEEFVLTGSERAADQAAARGQMELAPAEEPAAKERPATMYKALPESGFKRLSKDDERTYRDEGGKSYPTFERDGARIALSSNEVLYENENGDVEVGVGEPNETIVRALLVDPATRGQGVASKVMDDLTKLADEYGVTLYLEPTAISDKPVPAEKLKQFYSSKGFVTSLGASNVMERRPVKPERSTQEIREEMIPLRDERTSLYSKAGKPPAIGTPKRARFDELQDKLRELIAEYDAAEERERGQTFLNIEPIGESVAGDNSTRTPSLKRKVKVLNRQREQGKISDQQFVNEVDSAVKQDEEQRTKGAPRERVRGADFIRQKLLEAKRRGDLSAEGVELAEWFIQQNEALVDDLGIAIKTPKQGGTAGMYNKLARIMVLMKEASNDSTVVHEILHHLERMMPSEVQAAIRKEWLGSLLRASRNAKSPQEKLFFAALINHHFGSGFTSDITIQGEDTGKVLDGLIKRGLIDGPRANSQQLAIEMIRNGLVPYDRYQYVNPSEFWAVRGSDIVQGRFNAIKGGVLAKLKNWLKELGQKIKSAFGLRSDAPLIKALDSLAKGDGKFVSKDMLGEGENFLQVGKNIYGRTPIVAWTMPDETKLDSRIYTLQDKLIDTKRVIQSIEKSIGSIEDKWNPYLQEELFHGRTATETRDFLAGEVRPLLEQMQKEGVTIPELEEYLHNRFAPVRNENIAKINPLMPDGGSGIDTADAKAYMAALSPEQKAKYEKLAARVDAITNGTRQYLVASGLEDAETIEEWEKSSPGYVPLNREDVEYSTTVGTGTGLGFSVRGPSSRRATGSKRQVVDILANTIMQRERALVRGEKNRVATALYGLAMQNPNPDYWLAVNPDAAQSRKKVTEELVNMGLSAADAEGIMKEPTQKVVDSQTGMVTTRINPVLRSADNVLGVRINGKDRFIFFNTQNERGLRMARSLKNLDADQLGQIMSTMAAVTRYFASVNTQYNPVFGLYNFLRDLQGGAIQLSNTPIADKRAEVLSPKNLAGALSGIYQTLRTDRKRGQQVMTPWADLWLEFQREGGQTGYRDMFSRSQERANALQKELNRLSEGKGKKAALAVPRAVFDWLADYNETLENAVRLTAYKAALDKGLSKEQAASVAKNLTVNFNRKGQIGVQAGALYAFFNSSVQGTTRLLQTVVRMDRPGDIKSLSLTKAGKTIVYGGLLLGVVQAMMMAAMGFDEEEPPDFVKDRNLIIPLPDGKYLAWPLPLGYHVIPAFSRILTEWAIAGGKDPGKRIAHLVGLLLDAFSPIGNAGLSVQSIAPTIFDPIVALFENKDWTGKKIAKEDFNKLDPTPGYTRAKQNASWIGKQLSYYLNLASGGDKDKPGIVSPTPDQIDYLIGQATGGVGREVMKAAKSAEAMYTGEELAPYNIPIVGRFYGDTKAGYAESSRFYKNLEEINILENQYKGRQKRQEGTADFVKENPKVRLAQAAHETERNIQRLRKQRDRLIEKGAPKEQVKAIENRMTLQMKRLNDKAAQMEK